MIRRREAPTGDKAYGRGTNAQERRLVTLAGAPRAEIALCARVYGSNDGVE